MALQIAQRWSITHAGKEVVVPPGLIVLHHGVPYIKVFSTSALSPLLYPNEKIPKNFSIRNSSVIKRLYQERDEKSGLTWDPKLDARFDQGGNDVPAKKARKRQHVSVDAFHMSSDGIQMLAATSKKDVLAIKLETKDLKILIDALQEHEASDQFLDGGQSRAYIKSGKYANGQEQSGSD